MAWTEDRVEVLKKLWAEGLSASQIAKQLGGVTRNAVIGKVHRLGLSGRATPSRPPSRVGSALRPRPAVRPAPSKPGSTAPRTTANTGVAPLRTPNYARSRPAAVADGDYASILTLSDHICRWPIGDPGDADFKFCGKKCKPGSPYCDTHAQMAYQPVRKRKRTTATPEAALDAIAASRKHNW